MINDSDREFLEKINLEIPLFNDAKLLLMQNKQKKAVEAIAKALFAEPKSFHPFAETDIQPIANFLNKHYQPSIKQLCLYADTCLLRETPRKPKTLSDEMFRFRFLSAIKMQKDRSSGAYLLIRLYHLTHEKKYLHHFYKIAKTSIENLEEIPIGPRPAGLNWHPSAKETSGHDPAHILEELILAFPFYRTLLTLEQKIFFAKSFAKLGGFLHRAIGYDAPFNIPLHFITSVHLVACIFPEYKEAEKWKSWSRKRIFDDYTSEYNVTKEGYFREGLGYQNVVHNLLLKNLMFWKASGDNIPKKLLQNSETSFEFATKLLRINGTTPLVADATVFFSHEPHIVSYELLNKAAIFFNRPDFLHATGTPKEPQPKEILFWDLGWQGIQKWQKLKKIAFDKRQFKNHSLPNSGFQVLGSGNLKNGHYGLLAYANNINHAHFDVGSIDIWGLGRSLISDPGFSTYKDVAVAKDSNIRSHNLTLLTRLKPLGPRLDLNSHNLTTQVFTNPTVSGATFVNTLYETCFVIRTLALLKPSKDPLTHFWLVIDSIKRKIPWQGRSEPYELAETYFHINAPESNLSIKENSYTVWSNHTGKNRFLSRYSGEDVNLNGKSQKFNYHECLDAIKDTDSNANIQITAIPKTNDHHYDFGMQVTESYTCQYGGRVKRPAVCYKYNGYLPYTIAYVLMPFRGLKKQAYANVIGEQKKNKTEITIDTANYNHKIEINHVKLEKPTIKMHSGKVL